MKKIASLAVAAVIVLTVMCGCTAAEVKRDEIYKKAVGFEAEMSVKKGDTVFAFTVTRLKPDYFEFIFTEPSILDKFDLIINGGEVRLKYYGFEISLNRFPLPVSDGINRIAEVLAILDEGFEKLEPLTDGGDLVFGGDGFKVKISPESNLPLYFEIETESGNYEITVKDFRLTAPSETDETEA